MTTPNRNYNVPDEGDEDWHIPVNENWNDIDADVHEALQGVDNVEFVASDEDAKPIIEGASSGTVVRYRPGTHRRDGDYDITVPDGVKVHIPKGTTVEAPDISGYEEDGGEDRPRIFRLYGDNSAIYGGGVIDGRRTENPILQEEHDDSDHEHGHEHHIDVNGNWAEGKDTISNVFIGGGLTLENGIGGDGIYLHRVENVRIENVEIDWMYRNGFASNDHLTDVLVRNVRANNTEGRHDFGFDCEPLGSGNNGNYHNVRFENIAAVGNGHSGFAISRSDHTDTQYLDITVDGFYTAENADFGVHLGLVDIDGQPPVRVRNVYAIENGVTGVYLGRNLDLANIYCIGNGTDRTGVTDSVGLRTSSDGHASHAEPENVTIRGLVCHPGIDAEGDDIQETGVNLLWGKVELQSAYFYGGTTFDCYIQNDSELYYGTLSREDGSRNKDDLIDVNDTAEATPIGATEEDLGGNGGGEWTEIDSESDSGDTDIDVTFNIAAEDRHEIYRVEVFARAHSANNTDLFMRLNGIATQDYHWLTNEDQTEWKVAEFRGSFPQAGYADVTVVNYTDDGGVSFTSTVADSLMPDGSGGYIDRLENPNQIESIRVWSDQQYRARITLYGKRPS